MMSTSANRLKELIAFSCLSGLLAGLSLSVYGHTANGFLAAPGIVFGLGASAMGIVVAVILLSNGRRRAGWILAAVSISMLGALIVAPLIWPYPASSPP